MFSEKSYSASDKLGPQGFFFFLSEDKSAESVYSKVVFFPPISISDDRRRRITRELQHGEREY